MEPLHGFSAVHGPLTIDALAVAPSGASVLLTIEGDARLRVELDLATARRLMFRLGCAHVQAIQLAAESGADAAIETALAAAAGAE